MSFLLHRLRGSKAQSRALRSLGGAPGGVQAKTLVEWVMRVKKEKIKFCLQTLQLGDKSKDQRASLPVKGLADLWLHFATCFGKE